ncbi:MAG TPA: hypothetical protein VKY33_07490 [Flavobacterium sp.]|nr:hypothetical protein [Flavobacterium sp.]
MTKNWKIILVALFISFCGWSQADQFYSYTGGTAQFNTYEELMNGKTEPNQLNVIVQHYNPSTTINRWKITIRLTDDFMFSGHTVPAEIAYLEYSNQNNNSSNPDMVVAPSGPIPLSKFQETVLISSDNIPVAAQFFRTFMYHLHISGGNHLLTVPNGVYTSGYILSLYEVTNNGDQLLQTFQNTNARFQINYIGNHGDQLVGLQNGATQFVFNFSDETDWTQGMALTKQGGLKVKTYQGHELIVKSSKEQMQSSVSEHQLPVAVLEVDLKLHSFSSGNISDVANLQIFTPVTLQVWDQPVARFPGWSSEITYDLTLRVRGNQPDLMDAKGRYDTYVYFVIVPL